MCKSVAAGGWVGCLACMLPRPSVLTASRGLVTHHGTIQNQRRSTISIHSVSDRTGGCHIQLIISLSFLLLAFVVVLVLFPPQSFFFFVPFVPDTKNVKRILTGFYTEPPALRREKHSAKAQTQTFGRAAFDHHQMDRQANDLTQKRRIM